MVQATCSKFLKSLIAPQELNKLPRIDRWIRRPNPSQYQLDTDISTAKRRIDAPPLWQQVKSMIMMSIRDHQRRVVEHLRVHGDLSRKPPKRIPRALDLVSPQRSVYCCNINPDQPAKIKFVDEQRIRTGMPHAHVATKLLANIPVVHHELRSRHQLIKK
ncbi:hypothetical protein SAMN05421504_11639 [Amycolatopsis xylanica]|uniref:Uncharacterized protein n=1 Tax=Amycolatopsis xylanica TaxID=589385 RepID=A0A1H3SXT5_9PSEU|nr:hypothetical protein [Amycolatopsis xylanica]SDZ42590.1 hypothetical protein SAMN05421504_11639 [Amycolatopsis xylanica]